jgi:hypothetical protein
MRRMEDKIRMLIRECLAASDDKEQMQKLVELRAVLHQHMQVVRTRLFTYPMAEERRLQDRIPPPEMPTREIQQVESQARLHQSPSSDSI